MMKKIISLFLMIHFFFSCTPEKKKDTSTTQTFTSIRESYVYGNDRPFQKEFGEVIRYQNKDSIILSFCVDSFHRFHPNQLLRNNTRKCFDKKEYIINNKMLVTPHVTAAGNMYRRDTFIKTISTTIEGKPITLHKTKTNYSSDVQGDKLIYHSTEYWNDQLGLILKMDNNTSINRKRIIQALEIQNELSNENVVQELLQEIYQDSSDWLIAH